MRSGDAPEDHLLDLEAGKAGRVVPNSSFGSFSRPGSPPPTGATG
jgi:hypothetical protein